MKKLTVDKWIEEIDSGLEFRKLYGLEQEWSSLEAMFYSVHESSAYGGPNLISSTADAILSQLSVPIPAVVVKAKRPGLTTASRVLESVDNTLLSELNVGREVEAASLHAFLWGKGILKHGYDSEFGYSPDFVLGEELGLTLTQYDLSGKMIEFSRAKPGMPWVSACLPHDIVVPFGTKTLDDASWIAHRVVRHVDDIKKDVKYKNTKDLKAVMSMDDFVKSYQTLTKPYRVGSYDSFYSDTGESNYCELWEIHDRRTKRILVIATGHDKFLRDDEDLLQINGGLPFTAFSFVPLARTFWTTPDSFYIKPYQAELCDIVNQASKQRRLAILKFLYLADSFEDGELEKVLSNDVGVGAKVKAGRNIKEVLQPLTMPNNNLQLYQDADYIRRSARETVGFSRNQMGEFEQTGRRTATEAKVVREASGLRMSRRQKIIKEVYEDVIRKVNNVIFTFWKNIRWTEVSGGEGAQWIEYIGSQLKSDYSYNVTFSPAVPETAENRKQFAMQLFTVFSQVPGVNPAELIKYLINAFNDSEIADIFGGIQDMPMQQGQPAQQGQQGQAGQQKPAPGEANALV